MWLIAQLKEREDRLFIPQLYASINAFFEQWSLPGDKRHEWRLTPVQVGQLRACPHSQGVLVATDGVRCYIETGDTLFLGHLANWERFDFDLGADPSTKATPRSNIFKELAAEAKEQC